MGSIRVTLGVSYASVRLWIRLFGLGGASWDSVGLRERKKRALRARSVPVTAVPRRLRFAPIGQ